MSGQEHWAELDLDSKIMHGYTNRIVWLELDWKVLAGIQNYGLLLHINIIFGIWLYIQAGL